MEKTYCVFNQTGESFLGLSVRRADTSLTRLRGLLGRVRIQSGEGLWIVPSSGVHTVGMMFPIDVIYLDAQKRVLHLIEHMQPFRIGPVFRKCRTVLEFPLHTIYSSQTHVGDQLLICRPEEMEAYLKNAKATAQNLATVETKS